MAFSITVWAKPVVAAHFATDPPHCHGKLVNNLEKLSVAIPSR
jgi:hypothetical protein